MTRRPAAVRAACQVWPGAAACVVVIRKCARCCAPGKHRARATLFDLFPRARATIERLRVTREISREREATPSSSLPLIDLLFLVRTDLRQYYTVRHHHAARLLLGGQYALGPGVSRSYTVSVSYRLYLPTVC